MNNMRRYGFAFNEIKLNDAREFGIEQVQLLRTGTFNHAVFGKFEVTKKVLRDLVKNFSNNARRVELAVDYFHESGKEAAGWIREVELREKDSELWIDVEWTPNAKNKILEKELRYLSADFDFNYTDSETGKTFGPTLFGGGLTNRPHVKDMRPILSEEDIKDLVKKELEKNVEIKLEESKVTYEELEEAVGKLSDDEKKKLLKGFNKDKDLQDDKEDDEMNAEEKKKLEEGHTAELAEKDKEIIKLKRENKFNVLLSEGKAVEAQRVAYLENDMDKFLEGKQEVNLSEQGKGTNEEAAKEKKDESKEKKDSELSLSEAEDKVAKLAEAKIEKNDSLDLEAATDLVLNENEDLYKRIYG